MPTATVGSTAPERRTLCGGDPDEPYPVPPESAFDQAGEPRLHAEDLEALARRLIAVPALDLGHLQDVRVGVLWTRAGGKRGGKARLAAVSLANADLKHYTALVDGRPLDALVKFAADHCRDGHLTRWQVAAQLAHALSRIGSVPTREQGEERLTLVAPDASLFRAVVRVFGTHSLDLRLAANALAEARQTTFLVEDAAFAGNGGAEPGVAT